MASLELNPKSLGLAGGILWGLVCIIMAFVSQTGYGLGLVHGLATIYIGYQAGFIGAILGGIYGFIDGFIGFFIVAWIYNYFNK